MVGKTEVSASRGLRRKVVTAIQFGLVLAVLAGGYGYYRYLHRFDLPLLPLPDLGPDRAAGVIEQVVGTAYSRIWSPNELEAKEPSKAPLSQLKNRDPFLIPTFFQVAPKARVQTVSNGAWIVSLEDGGEFILEDARTDVSATSHTQQWRVARGTFRAKVYDYAKGLHVMQVILPHGWLILKNGEVGMKVDAEGRGTLWVRRGECDLFYLDGTRKHIEPGGLNYL
jgi:hypothetical protein